MDTSEQTTSNELPSTQQMLTSAAIQVGATVLGAAFAVVAAHVALKVVGKIEEKRAAKALATNN